jgi:predicted alpha/beta-hydrolase family hydrolase
MLLVTASVSVQVQEIFDPGSQPAVRGALHTPASPNGDALVLTHGAGADYKSRLLVALAGTFAEAGFTVLRCNLPFRQKRPHGPPFPGSAPTDQEGLRRAVAFVSQTVKGRTFLGGHSYGGRQASMLAAREEDNQFAAGLLLLSYPLHPPKKPDQLRTAHFPQLKTPALFVHGSHDGFGSHEELQTALRLIPGRTQLLGVTGSGHELLPRKTENDLPAQILQAFMDFFFLDPPPSSP